MSTTNAQKKVVYLIHHIFLPPQLPQKCDFNLEYEKFLLDTTIDALRAFKSHINNTQYGQGAIVDSVVDMVTNMMNVHEFDGTIGAISEENLLNALAGLSKTGGTIPLYVRAQNAGVMISRVDDSIHVEAFELSPLNEAVITTKGRLRRSFPGPANSINFEVFGDPSFQAAMAQTLAKMSHQAAMKTQPQARKAERMHDEDRDTTHPKMVTELFTAFLGSVGEPVNVSRVWKNTREEVMYYDSRHPWRRSPTWLFVRVAMQLLFSRMTTQQRFSGNLYKPFIVFLMSHVLKLSHQHRLRFDFWYAMNAKLGRRLLKLDPDVEVPGLDFVRNAMRQSNQVLNSKWSSIMEGNRSRIDLSGLANLDFRRDIFNSLPSFDEYIKSLSQRKDRSNSVDFEPQSDSLTYQAEELPTCINFSKTEYKSYNLKAFEDWVTSNLSRWLESHQADPATCSKLGYLIQSYHRTASISYSGNPETLSLMLLTILELWIACDKSAVHICLLLRDYDPEIPGQLLQSLILPLRSQMERLLRAEDYLDRRRANVRSSSPSIFREFGSQHSFSVRYFDQSLEHQNLIEEIRKRATQAKEEKQSEFHQKRERYKNLMELYHESECDFSEGVINFATGARGPRHHGNCTRCGHKSQAASLNILIHEWPLPKNEIEARSTVFELKVPLSFRCWRDTTVFILLDVFKTEFLSEKKPRKTYPLQNYNGLSSYFTRFSSTQRIGLLSEDKPHEVTHRRNKSIAATSDINDVCLDNGLHYKYYDASTKCFVDMFRITDKVPIFCTYRMPAESSSLQKFLFRPSSIPNGPSPNTLVASQSDCPDHMSLEEYKALSGTPLGYRIQWQNILQLSVTSSVDFKKVETSLTILQCIHQTGPPSSGGVLRAGHEILDDDNLAHAILKALREALQRVKENWESSQALSTYISLAARLLSLTSSDQIKEGCLLYLANVRVVAFEWVNILRDKAQMTMSDDQRTYLCSRALEVALVCVDSFNFDERYLEDLLAIPEDLSLLIQCSIVIQEGDYTLAHTSDPIVSLLYQRWKGLTYRCYPILATKIVKSSSSSLDVAIIKSWSAYKAGSGWRRIPEQDGHWLMTRTAPQENSNGLWVHFNLLTGELLVNGLPLARLPLRYEQHPMYRTLFASCAMEVLPTSVPGLEFSGKKEYAGYTLHFGIGQSSDEPNSLEHDLLVQAIKGDKKYELVPSRHLHGNFPVFFVEEFVHWYDCYDNSLEFRPVKSPWNSSPNNWRLAWSTSTSGWHMAKDNVSLVGIKSQTVEKLSHILNPLEDPLRIHTFFHQASSLLEIELPRLQLGFYLERGGLSIQSRQFRGMSIDMDQSLGTLVGLRSRLMLKHDNGGNRLVILPEGNVTWQAEGGHIHVMVDKDSATKAHAYHVDDKLGRLIDNGNLQSKLTLCYLHALTSFCLSDPLTRTTGTEQALSILSSAAVRSFDQLEQKNIEVLHQIAQLTPGRKYYPANERVMQTVSWVPNLGFLAQHGGFYKSVKSIFDQADRANIFYPDSKVKLPPLDQVEVDLLQRDCIRSSTFRVSGFGAEDHTVNHDKVYGARDQQQSSSRYSEAFVMSSMIYHERTTLQYRPPSHFRDHLWKYLSQTQVSSKKLFGSRYPLQICDMKYDARLLEKEHSSDFLSEKWCALHQTFSRERFRVEKFHLMLWFSTLAFASNADMEIIQTLASFYTLPYMAQLSPPQVDSFQISQGRDVKRHELRDSIKSACLPLLQCPEAHLTAWSTETKNELRRRKQEAFQCNQSNALDKLRDALAKQFPSEVPVAPADDTSPSFRTYVDVRKAIDGAKPKFRTWFDNLQFYKYLTQIEDALLNPMVKAMQIPSCSFTPPKWNLERRHRFISIDDILTYSTAPKLACVTNDLSDLLLTRLSHDPEKTTPRLAALIKRLEAQAGSNYEEDYVKDLRESLACLQHEHGKEYALQGTETEIKMILSGYLVHCQNHVKVIYTNITSNLNCPVRVDSTLLQLSKFSAQAASVMQWPRLSPIFLLQQLTRCRWQKITGEWKRCIVEYGLSLTELQRAERLVSSSDNHADLIKELQNSGHQSWSPLDYPESLLLEVESGIMIREVQVRIAEQMRSPPSGSNFVMQLNMGEGKSSVVVPNVAASLADGSRLVRVIVAKPQSKQMLQMMVSKLGGLLDRRVYHMPFSRSLRLGEAEANAIGDIYKECMTNGGVLLLQPEHILSFKLMGLECLISGQETVGNSLLSTQHFFDSSSRDIVDESDENFSVKFELIYTMGMQRPIELCPERWTHVQQVLNLVKIFAPSVKKKLPLSIEVDEHTRGNFPKTRVLRPDAGKQLFDHVAKHICETGLDGFPIARQPEKIRNDVFRYITEPILTSDEIECVEKGEFWTDTTSSILLLIRGLIAGGVLAFTFSQKRWKVNYGLDATRIPKTRLTVPYRAKDNPTPRSEFSHPDVVIVLTSLCYYYGGMTNDDLFLALAHLLKCDQADIEYQEWVKDAPDLALAFHNLAGVNPKDRQQCINQVFPHFRYAKGAVDYFLAHVVFPKEMKEFPEKLSASGWDIGQIKAHPTTGFSGTNDSRKVLPLSVKHLDLPEQKDTNALVLEYLLQSENSVALIPSGSETLRSDAEVLLAMVTKMKPAVQVILDVGAQILELGNLGFAREWLRMSDLERAQAVVFFGDNDELSILDRKGNIEPFQTSSFAKQLDVCVIFLDEAHTRGTDLILPPDYRAAVTLGPNLTKDRLVQACMRMRKLGKGQSVVFCVPEEIKTKILERTSKPDDADIELPDVLIWAISETCVDIRRSMPLWAAQGRRFEQQREIWAEARTDNGITLSKAQAEKFLEDESRTLDARYRPRSGTNTVFSEQESENANLNLIMERCREFKDLDLNSATLQEEQERELSPEIEQERQIEKPAPAQPAEYHIHPDLIKFISTGIPIRGSTGYSPAFETLRNTSAGKYIDVSQFPKDLLVTSDFANTILTRGTSYISDSYQRSVQWVLTSTGGKDTVQHMMVISPHEAQELLPRIKASKTTTLHLYGPRQNLGFRSLDALDLYNVPARPGTLHLNLPRHLIIQLSLFAGQLYLASYDEYKEVCNFLGLAWTNDCPTFPDGFIVRNRGDLKSAAGCTFSDSPVMFMKVLTTKIRRHCEGVDKTHMGKILDSIVLQSSDFEGEHGV
ncbi:hypothetical protein LHYA1_G005662 [Lachnellula hyalina]|uniref:ubiquitinyl hydrolase 1 n=1 Tax=Lachnellula hyalina TaxID=1316788 RepID=A0A8H8TZI9_9HELO|nr:uncharacterized protein LHYA1_G005662 [Lachnellula hyalina]TVY25882.1 hypothetical protein LHYA1_G005662 [Lachnellula hyalina]